MKTHLSIALAAGLLAGCGDDATGPQGEPGRGEPTITLLTPAASFLARSTVVQIAGELTHFGAASVATIDDAEIRAATVSAGSKGNLRAAITISDKARLGAHTVTVTTPGAGSGGADEVAVLSGGLVVQSSLFFEMPAAGQQAASALQGGVVQVGLRNLDFQLNPFSGARVSVGGRSLGSVAVTGTRYSSLVLVDVLAPAGALSLSLGGVDPLGLPVTYVSDPQDTKAVQVTPRAATILGPGVPRLGESFGAPGQTNLYKVTTTADDQVVAISYANLGANLGSGIASFYAPSSGRFIEGAAMTASTAPSAQTSLLYAPRAGDLYLSTIEPNLLGGATGYGYGITATVTTARRLTLKEPLISDSPGAPLADLADLDAPSFAIDGAIDGAADADYVRFKASASGRVYVQAVPPAGSIAIDLYNSACSGPMMVSGNFQVEMAVTAGVTYCARVTANPARTYQFVISQGP